MSISKFIIKHLAGHVLCVSMHQAQAGSILLSLTRQCKAKKKKRSWPQQCVCIYVNMFTSFQLGFGIVDSEGWTKWKRHQAFTLKSKRMQIHPVETAVALEGLGGVVSTMDGASCCKAKLSWLLVILVLQQFCRRQSPELQPRPSPMRSSSTWMCCSCLNCSGVWGLKEKNMNEGKSHQTEATINLP